jgi:DNA-binding beta-propeller fold protein YncE
VTALRRLPRAIARGVCVLSALGVTAAAQTGAPRWPPAPEPARIRFVRSIDPAAVRGKPSFFSKVLRVLIGDREEPRMRQPYGVAVAADGTIYVADTYGKAIHVYDLKKPAYRSIAVDGGSLIGVAVAGNRLFVTDSESGRLLALDLKGRVQWTLGPKQGLQRPTGLVAANDQLYVVDTLRHCVVMVSFTGVIGERFGSRGDGEGEFNFPTNIARSQDGRLYVTDAMNFRVQIFDRAGRFIRAFGQLGDGSGDFDKPKGIAVDGAGRVYVVEGLNDVVQVFDDEGRLLLVFGGSGTRDGELYLPSGIAIVNDLVYVADSANRRVAMFERLRVSP